MKNQAKLFKKLMMVEYKKNIPPGILEVHLEIFHYLS